VTSNLPQPLARIPEALQPDAGLVHQRQVQAAHLAVRFVQVIEDPAGLDLAAAADRRYPLAERVEVVP
jgi:hypothetical protein